MTYVNPELIERAAWHTDWDQHEYRITDGDWTPYCICGWKSEESHDVEDYDRHITGIVLATVADDLRDEGAVQALRDAADECGREAEVSASPRYGFREQAGEWALREGWLRARADRIEAGR